MCKLKRSGAFTEKHDFVNLTVLSMEIALQIVCHFSFEIMGFFIRFFVTHSLKRSKQITDNTFQTLSEIML